MNGSQIAEKLRQALALMNDNGKHWTQGTSYRPSNKSYCAIGAIRQATLGTPWDDGDPRGSGPDAPVVRALAELLPQVPTYETFDTTYMNDGQRIVAWNDSSKRTWPDVVVTFEKAAELAEAGDAS